MTIQLLNKTNHLVQWLFLTHYKSDEAFFMQGTELGSFGIVNRIMLQFAAVSSAVCTCCCSFHSLLSERVYFEKEARIGSQHVGNISVTIRGRSVNYFNNYIRT